ncbi:MAG TPA: hypothetical protein VI643_03725, partial [Planctomycetota bacterium]|nr:hypothetical protein [Planctomycetota bacterium]
MAGQARPVWFQLWTSLKPAQRVGVAALAAIFLGGLALLAATSGGDGMVRLVQGAKPDVISALAASGIRFETRADGVYVARPDHERAVVQLLACGNGDRELFEGVFGDWLGSRDTREKKFQIALQEKLRAMIRSFEGVEDARVQITPAEPSQTLAKTGIPAKASIFVTLRKGRRELTSGEARGIANLVAGAVRGLEPKNVAVADPTGRTYDPEGVEAAVSDFFGEQRKHEQALEEKVRRHLAQHYPKVIVSAFVRLSRRSIERRTSEQTHSAQGPQKGPDEDVSTDRPHWKGASSPEAEGEAVQSSQRRTEERENILPGDVERASMSITIPVDPGREHDPVEWISTTVSKATGIPPGEITVKLIPFVPEPAVS